MEARDWHAIADIHIREKRAASLEKEIYKHITAFGTVTRAASKEKETLKKLTTEMLELQTFLRTPPTPLALQCPKGKQKMPEKVEGEGEGEGDRERGKKAKR